MIEKFMNFEEKYQLFDLKIDDFELWIYIRFEIYFAIGAHFGISNGVGSTPKASLKDKKELFCNVFIRNPYYKLGKKDVLIISHQRRILEDGKYRCIYTDDIADHLEYSNVTAEFLFGSTHLRPAKTKQLIYLDYIDIIPVIKYKCSHKNKMIFYDVANRIVAAIRDYFDVNISLEYIVQLIQKRYFYRKYKKNLIRKLLEKIQPKVILEVVGYETNKLIFNEVAHEMRIPCIELQHGVIGKGHIAYNYHIKKKPKQLPTYLFVYSQYWKDTCSFPIGNQNIIVTGFPYMEEQKKKYYLQKHREKTFRILVYSSTDSTEALQVFTEEMMRMLDKRGYNYRVIYKLHPLEYNYNTTIWDKLKRSNKVEFINSPIKSLYELFSRADIQIGVKTTAIFEGLSYGLGTFILDTGAPDIDYYMGDLVKMGFATYGKNASEFCEYLENNYRVRKGVSYTSNNAFFIENSLNNICNEMSNIIAQKDKHEFKKCK